MSLRRNRTRNVDAFTLIELLVVISIIAVLAAIILPIFGRTKEQANMIKTLSNMKQMGAAMLAYAGENNYLLPNRVVNPDPSAPAADKWPILLKPYLGDPAVYTSPIPDVGGKSYKVTPPYTVYDNATNRTSYIYNGMNDRGALEDPAVAVRLNTIDQPTMTILLGIPTPQSGQFYMDFKEPGGNNNTVLNKTAFSSGTVYVFCDGSSRLLAKATDATANAQKPPNSGIYTDWLWLTDKSQTSIIH